MLFTLIISKFVSIGISVLHKRRLSSAGCCLNLSLMTYEPPTPSQEGIVPIVLKRPPLVQARVGKEDIGAEAEVPHSVEEAGSEMAMPPEGALRTVPPGMVVASVIVAGVPPEAEASPAVVVAVGGADQQSFLGLPSAAGMGIHGSEPSKRSIGLFVSESAAFAGGCG